MRDDFTKNIKISFDSDKASFQKIKDMVESLGSGFKIEGFSKEQTQTLKNLFKSLKDSKIDILSEQFTGDLRAQLKLQKEYTDRITEIEHRLAKLRELSTAEAKAESEKLEKQLEVLKEEMRVKHLTREEAPDTGKKGSELKKSLKEYGTNLKDLFQSNLKQRFDIGTKFINGLDSLVTKALNGLKQIIQDAWEEGTNMLKYSQNVNAQIREQAFAYGLSAAQNYAFDKTKELLGIGGDEDLFYAMQNPQLQAKFQEKFSEYSTRYSKLYDSGFFQKIQEFNWEWEEFKQDMQYEFLDFFVKNKETIMNALKTGMEGLKTLVNLTTKILYALGERRERSAAEHQAVRNEILGVTSSTVTSTTNVKIDNSFTNVAREDQTWLANAGELTYEQVIRALSSGR